MKATPILRMKLFVLLVVAVVSSSLLTVNLLAQPGSTNEPAVTNKFYAASGKWVQASNTNGVIWSSWPRMGESVTWKGGVLDGKAHGKGMVQWYTNGVPTTQYEGELKGGLALRMPLKRCAAHYPHCIFLTACCRRTVSAMAESWI